MIDRLICPCSYQGAKQRVAKEIVDYIFKTTPIYSDTKIYDLCCGSGAITIEFLNRGIKPKQITMLDISSWGEFWKHIGNGTFDINTFYKYSKAVPRDKSLIQSHMKELSKTNVNKDEAYKYILLQAASFGGKQIWNQNGEWKNTSFRDYWQPTATSKRQSPVNPMQPMIDVLEKRVLTIAEKCKGVTGLRTDVHNILNIVANENAVIYIDPPYDNTTGYGFNFNYHDFLSALFDKTLSPIFISEKERISGDEAIQLNFSSDKGGINGNKTCKNEEWLNVFR